MNVVILFSMFLNLEWVFAVEHVDFFISPLTKAEQLLFVKGKDKTLYFKGTLRGLNCAEKTKVSFDQRDKLIEFHIPYENPELSCEFDGRKFDSKISFSPAMELMKADFGRWMGLGGTHLTALWMNYTFSKPKIEVAKDVIKKFGVESSDFYLMSGSQIASSDLAAGFRVAFKHPVRIYRHTFAAGSVVDFEKGQAWAIYPPPSPPIEIDGVPCLANHADQIRFNSELKRLDRCRVGKDFIYEKEILIPKGSMFVASDGSKLKKGTLSVLAEIPREIEIKGKVYKAKSCVGFSQGKVSDQISWGAIEDRGLNCKGFD
jgi:hypothetical protein